MTPAEVLAAAADRLDALAKAATAGPWTAEANSCITRLPSGVAHEFSSWAVFSPEMDDENPTTMVAGPERDPRDQKLWGGIWESVDARYIAAMNPLVGKALAAVFRAWARMGRLDPDLLRRVGGDETVALARLIIGGES